MSIDPEHPSMEASKPKMPPLNSLPTDDCGVGIELSYDSNTSLSPTSSLHDSLHSSQSMKSANFGSLRNDNESCNSFDDEDRDKELELNPIKLRMQIAGLQTVATQAQVRAMEAETKVANLQSQLDDAEKKHKLKMQEMQNIFDKEKIEIYTNFDTKIKAMEKVETEIQRSFSRKLSSNESGSIEGSCEDFQNRYYINSLKESLKKAENEAASNVLKVKELESVIEDLKATLQQERQKRIEDSEFAARRIDEFKEESAKKFSQVKKLCEGELKSIQEANRESLLKKEEAIKKIRADMKEKLMSMHETSMGKIKKLEDLHKTEITERDDLITKYKKNRQYLISLRVHEEKAAAARLGDLKFDMMMKINEAQKAAADALNATEEKLKTIQEVHKSKLVQKDQALEESKAEIKTLKTWADEEKISLHKLEALKEEMETRLRNAKSCADEELRLAEDK